jgi:ribosome maturation protein SDO1
MVTLDDAVIARLSSHGSEFELLVDPKLATEVREGEDVELEDLLAVQNVFKDARAGDKASEERIEDIFGTKDLKTVAYEIIRKGDIQLTTAQRREMVENKRRSVINFISRNSVDPRTGLPHPPNRIEKAMEEARSRIDPFESVQEQVKRVVKDLRPLLPLRFEVRTIAVKIPAEYTGRAYGEVRSFGELKKQEWQKDGSWIGLIEIPVGVEQEFYSVLGKVTSGEVETKVVERK